MVRHQPLQYYEPQLCLSCLTGIYGCRWKRYQRSHDDTTPVSPPRTGLKRPREPQSLGGGVSALSPYCVALAQSVPLLGFHSPSVRWAHGNS